MRADVRTWVIDTAGKSTEEVARELLADELHLPADSLHLCKDPRGRPALCTRDGQPIADVDISLAHTGALLAIALAHGARVGVDIEIIPPDADDEDLARTFLAPTEYAQWHAIPAAERHDVLYQFWTAKEAFQKALGLGATIDMRDIVLAMQDDRRLRLISLYAKSDLIAGWRLTQEKRTLGDRVVWLAVVEAVH